MSQLLEILSKSRLFKNLDDEEILSFIQKFECKVVEYHKNDCIITKDEISHFIGIVLEGTIGIYTNSYYGDHTIISIGNQDYLFGFIAKFFNECKSITTLYCRNYCKVAYFRVKDSTNVMYFLQTTSDKILLNIYAMLTEHIRNDFDRMHIISTHSVLVKFVRYLLYRYESTGETTFDLVFNRTELASFLGVYRTSLSHCIKKLLEAGFISVSGSVVNILKLDSLISIECDSYEH